MDRSAKGVVWREVPGTAGRYQVSDQGSVKSVERRVWNSRGFWATRNQRLLKPSLRGPQGYAMVRLYMPDGQKRDVFVHRLVLEAFVGPCPDGMEACHLDDDARNNSLANLRWDTRSANIHDQVRNGSHNQASKTHCPEGHPFEGDNLLHYGHSRVCKICRRQYRREYYLRTGI